MARGVQHRGGLPYKRRSRVSLTRKLSVSLKVPRLAKEGTQSPRVRVYKIKYVGVLKLKRRVKKGEDEKELFPFVLFPSVLLSVVHVQLIAVSCSPDKHIYKPATRAGQISGIERQSSLRKRLACAAALFPDACCGKEDVSRRRLLPALYSLFLLSYSRLSAPSLALLLEVNRRHAALSIRSRRRKHLDLLAAGDLDRASDC